MLKQQLFNTVAPAHFSSSAGELSQNTSTSPNTGHRLKKPLTPLCKKSHRNLWRTNPRCMAKYPPMQPPISRARKAMAATPSSRCSRSPCSLIYSTHVVPDAAANKANTEPGPCSSLCCPGTGGCSAALSVPHPPA